MTSLKYYNLILFLIHLVLAISFSAYFANINKKYKNKSARGLEFTIRDHELTISEDPDTKVSTSQWSSITKKDVSEKTIQTLIILFFMLTAVFHLYYYMTSTGNYANMIKYGNNYVRWIEYSITSTIMLLIIALSSGVKDVNVYALIMVTNVAMIAQGQLIEEAIADGRSWIIPMVTGFALLIAEFGVIVNSFVSRIKEVDKFLKENPDLSENGGKGVPKWLYYMIFVLFAFFSSFGFISLWGAYSKVPYERVEKMYLIFSLAAKATLGAFLAYGLGQRQSQSEENK